LAERGSAFALQVRHFGRLGYCPSEKISRGPLAVSGTPCISLGHDNSIPKHRARLLFLQCWIERDNAYTSDARFHAEAIIAAGADIEQRFSFPNRQY